jgi:hypothetical protein
LWTRVVSSMFSSLAAAAAAVSQAAAAVVPVVCVWWIRSICLLQATLLSSVPVVPEVSKAQHTQAKMVGQARSQELVVAFGHQAAAVAANE